MQQSLHISLCVFFTESVASVTLGHQPSFSCVPIQQEETELSHLAPFCTHKMAIVDRPFSLSHDLELLERAIKRTNALLVVLDPLMAVLGQSIDSSRDQAIREVFTPLAQLAERTGCAILIIRHLTKGTSDNALYRGAGSIGIIAAARTGLLVAQDPSDENKRILATTKNNLSQRATNLSY